MEILCFDSFTQLSEASRGRAVLAAAHGGAYIAGVALRLSLGGVIVNYAGVGRERRVFQYVHSNREAMPS